MIAAPLPPPPEPSVSTGPRRSRLLVARDVVLGLGFLVILAGSVANIAHFVDSRSSEERVATDASSTDEVDLSVASTDEPVVTTDQPSVFGASVPTTPREPAVEAEPGTYVVARGDVLYEIAVQHGTTPQELAALNGLDDPNRIEVGQVLKLPDPGPGS